MNKKKKKQTNRALRVARYACLALAFIVIAIAVSAREREKKEEQQPWPPDSDIDDMSIEDLQKLLDQSLQQGIYELSIFYRDKIKERNNLKKTG